MNTVKLRVWWLCILTFVVDTGLFAQSTVGDDGRFNQVRREAGENSAVSKYAFYLTDFYGPRLSGSPSYRKAAEWVRRTLQDLGLDRVEFQSATSAEWSEPGWAYQRYGVRLLEPTFATLSAIPVPYSPPTQGKLTGEPIYFLLPGRSGLSVDEIMSRFKGRLKDRILLISDEVRPIADWWRPVQPPSTSVTRMKDEELLALREPPVPTFEPPAPKPAAPPSPARSRQEVDNDWRKLFGFLKTEGALAFLNATIGDNGTMLAMGPLGPPGIQPPPPPGFNLSMESYNRILRLMQHQIPVRLEVELESQFVDDRGHTSVLAEIRGRPIPGEIVIAGAHLDSYQVGTGASDNAANCAVLMEAMRILKAAKLSLARTVRIALWAGEERDTRGSAAYVKQWKSRGGEKLFLYLNLDGGGGRIRGLQVQERQNLVPIAERWLAPFKAEGQGFVSVRRSSGSDHVNFEKEGLPTAVVLQDPLYGVRTYHSNMDVYDYLIEDDLKQSAIFVAWVLYRAANEP
jgi:carboxypeptidase Q